MAADKTFSSAPEEIPLISFEESLNRISSQQLKDAVLLLRKESLNVAMTFNLCNVSSNQHFKLKGA